MYCVKFSHLSVKSVAKIASELNFINTPFVAACVGEWFVLDKSEHYS